MPFYWDDPRKKRTPQEPWHIQYGEPRDYMSKGEAKELSERAKRRLRNARMEPGICSKCRNPLVRDRQTGRTFHTPESLYDGPCPVGVVPEGERWPEPNVAVWPSGSSGGIISYAVEYYEPPLPRSGEFDVPEYYYFSLEDLDG